MYVRTPTRSLCQFKRILNAGKTGRNKSSTYVYMYACACSKEEEEEQQLFHLLLRHQLRREKGEERKESNYTLLGTLLAAHDDDFVKHLC